MVSGGAPPFGSNIWMAWRQFGRLALLRRQAIPRMPDSMHNKTMYSKTMYSKMN